MKSEPLENFSKKKYRNGPKTLSSKSKVYTKGRKLGSGSYGSVYTYQTKDRKYQVIVKVFNEAYKAESDCRSTHQLVTPSCMKSSYNHVLEQRCLGNILVMKPMDGDLVDFADDGGFRGRFDTVQDCIRQLASGLGCISRSTGWYTDVKPANILWKRRGAGTYFCLGDLDFCTEGESAVTTYSPPEGGGRRSCTEPGSVFGLGLLIMWIVHKYDTAHRNPYRSHWKKKVRRGSVSSGALARLKEKTCEGYQATIWGYSNMSPEWRMVIESMVGLEMTQRPSVKEVVDAFNRFPATA